MEGLRPSISTSVYDLISLTKPFVGRFLWNYFTNRYRAGDNFVKIDSLTTMLYLKA
jgi:hypothetical protein